MNENKNETNAARLRNLLTPIYNYFALLDQWRKTPIDPIKFEKMHELLEKEESNVREHLPEIKLSILKIEKELEEMK